MMFLSRRVQKIDSEMVFVIHGMGRTRYSMYPMERALRKQGYRVQNWSYSSYGKSLSDLSCAFSRAVTHVVSDCNIRKIHFVGHSLGGIIVRHFLATSSLKKCGRVVMLAPPNKGSHVVDQYQNFFSFAFGPMSDLRTHPQSVVNTIPFLPSHIEVGVIAGAADGKVSIDETQLSEQNDHCIVQSRHTFIMAHRVVQEQVIQFLHTGQFVHTS